LRGLSDLARRWGVREFEISHNQGVLLTVLALPALLAASIDSWLAGIAVWMTAKLWVSLATLLTTNYACYERC
jgi:hypothetical protein